MMFKDDNGYLVDETGDGGDSARAAGIVWLFGLVYYEVNKYESSGECVRHPQQPPWNNPKNFSRDQLMCLAPALRPEAAKRVLVNTLKRFCFAQNTERDVPGSTKHPYPHKVKEDDGTYKWRMFDYADPLLPHHIAHIAACAGYKKLSMLGWPLLALSIAFNSHDYDVEQNQLQCMVKTAGPWAVWLYKKCNTYWKLQTRYYWERRKQPEISEMIIANL